MSAFLISESQNYFVDNKKASLISEAFLFYEITVADDNYIIRRILNIKRRKAMSDIQTILARWVFWPESIPILIIRILPMDLRAWWQEVQ